MSLLPQDLERSVKRIVRRVIREGETQSRLSRGILSLAKKESADADALDRETLVRLVTIRICEFCHAEYDNGPLQSGQLMQTVRGFCTEV